MRAGTLRAQDWLRLERTDAMFSFQKTLGLFALIALGLLTTTSGCSEITEALRLRPAV
jgi:hypothetical protein